MKSLSSICLACLMAPACFAGTLDNIPATTSTQEVAYDAANLRASDWQARRKAFYDILALGHRKDAPQGNSVSSSVTRLLTNMPQEADPIKRALISSLAYENSVVQEADYAQNTARSSLSDEYIGYYSDLIEAVAALKDVRALDALFGAIKTGHMATASIAQFGNAALDRTIVTLSRSEDPETRQSAAMVISEMLDPSNVRKVDDPASKQKIKYALTTAANDEDPDVRIVAVEGFAKLGSPDVRPLIEKLAREDPYEASQHGGDKGRYPVRDAATEALRRFGQ